MTPDLPKTLCACFLGDGTFMCDCEAQIAAQVAARQATQEELFVDAHRTGDEQ